MQKDTISSRRSILDQGNIGQRAQKTLLTLQLTPFVPSFAEYQIKNEVANDGQPFVAVRDRPWTSYSDPVSSHLERFPAEVAILEPVAEDLLAVLHFGEHARVVIHVEGAVLGQS